MNSKSPVEVAFQEELATNMMMVEVCEQIADGGKLIDICQQMGLRTSTIYSLTRRVPEFRKMYDDARVFHADAIFDEILHIADTPLEVERVITRRDGSREVVVEDMVDHRRLQIDSRFKVASKLRRSAYGERHTHEHQGPEGGPIPVIVATMTAAEAVEAYRLTLNAE